MTVVVERKGPRRHRCALPWVHDLDNESIVRYQNCNRRWKAHHPGNPDYSRWKPLLSNMWKRKRSANQNNPSG